MRKSDMLKYVTVCLDDTGAVRDMLDMPAGNARLVGWQVGFEPVFVAVWSYLPEVKLTEDEAEDIATDYLIERNWFADGPVPADWVL